MVELYDALLVAGAGLVSGFIASKVQIMQENAKIRDQVERRGEEMCGIHLDSKGRLEMDMDQWLRGCSHEMRTEASHNLFNDIEYYTGAKSISPWLQLQIDTLLTTGRIRDMESQRARERACRLANEKKAREAELHKEALWNELMDGGMNMLMPDEM